MMKSISTTDFSKGDTWPIQLETGRSPSFTVLQNCLDMQHFAKELARWPWSVLMGAWKDKSCHRLQIHSSEKGQLQKGKTIIADAYARVLDAPVYWFVEELLSYQVGILYESEHYIKN